MNKKHIPLIIVLLICITTMYGCAGSEENSYDSGYNEGFEDGQEDGQEKGYEIGFDEGYSKCENSPENTYSNGYGDGYIDALVENKLLDEAMKYADDVGEEEYFLYALHYAGYTEEAKEYAKEKQLDYPE